MKDYLTEDTISNNYKYSCISIIGNDFNQKCKSTLIMIRGGFSTVEDANIHIQKLCNKNNKVDIFIGQVGYWLPISNNEYSNEKKLECLNLQMENIIKEKIIANKNYKNRVSSLKEGKNDNKENEEVKNDNEENEEVKNDNKENEEVKNDNEENEEVKNDNEEYNIVKNVNNNELQNDESMENQNYCCISFISPENNKEVYGLKIRGIFNKLEEANEFSEKLQKIDKYNHIYIAEINKWLEWNPNPDKIKSQKYENKMLNDIFEKKQENNENLEIFKAKKNEEELESNLENQLESQLENSEANQKNIINNIFE